MSNLTASPKAQILAAIHDLDDPAALREIADAAIARSREAGKSALAVGDAVEFQPTKGDHAGMTISGTVKRINQKTATIVDLEQGGESMPYRSYRVPFSMLTVLD